MQLVKTLNAFVCCFSASHRLPQLWLHKTFEFVLYRRYGRIKLSNIFAVELFLCKQVTDFQCVCMHVLINSEEMSCKNNKHETSVVVWVTGTLSSTSFQQRGYYLRQRSNRLMASLCASLDPETWILHWCYLGYCN